MEKALGKTPKYVVNISDQQRDMMLGHGRIPPQAIDLEEVVLGAIMIEKDALTSVIDILQPEVFYKDAHQRIFEAIQQLFSKSEPIDILTVTSELRLNGHLELVGGPYFISQLTNRVVSAANIEFHTRILIQKYIQREMIRISSEIIKDAYEDTTDIFDLLDKAESQLFAFNESNLRGSLASMSDLVQLAIKEIEAAKDSTQTLRGVGSGYTDLDKVTQGWQKSDLIILAARPGMGKTALALNMARNAAVIHDKAVAFFTLEMSAIQLVTRLISAETGFPSEKLRQGHLALYEWQQLVTGVSMLTNAKMIIDDTPQLTVFELRAKCRRLKQQHDIQIVFIDYLQMMRSGSDHKGNREQEISIISRSIKSLAKELNIPIVALSQLSRQVEQRAGSKKPMLSDLRESGAIEQDADLVLFIYRPEYYGLTEDENNDNLKGLALLEIAKHRNGQLATVELTFKGEITKFEERAQTRSLIGGRRTAAIPPKTQTMPSKMNKDLDDGFDTPPDKDQELPPF